MFKFTKERIVKAWPATLQIAVDGGKTHTHAITLDLKILDTDDYRKKAAQGDSQVIEAVVLGWDGIGDEAGQPLPFNDDNRDALAKHPGFINGALAAYLKAARGEASEKN